MKKNFLIAAVGMAVFSLSIGVQAAAIPSNQDITTADCSLLGSPVRINLSNNVVGAYECDIAATTVSVGACHQAGSRAARVVGCVNSAASGQPDDWNSATCPDGDGTAADGQFTIVDFTGFRARSSGGGVAGAALNGACNAAAAETLLE